MVKTLPLLLAALAASLSALSGSVAPAVPATTTPVAPVVAATTSAPVTFNPAANASDNWAGYMSDNGTYTEVGASWVVPTAAAGVQSFATDAAWIGIGGVSGRDLIQAGTETLVQDGATEYDAWYETLPDVQHTIPLAISAGDSVSVMLSETSPQLWHLTFKNTTTGKSYETDIAYDSSKSSAEWIEERPLVIAGRSAGYAPLDSFGTVQFTGAYAVKDGTRTSLSDLSAEPVSMIDDALTPLASPSVVAADGSFSVAETADAQTQSAAPAYTITTSHRHRRHAMPGAQIEVFYGF